ncbi:MAG: HEAT repeat domain-containing protein [Planctomycetota bacterium]|nr:HEAT repeat domain-containing protein [Planctomycetota bacterium]
MTIPRAVLLWVLVPGCAASVRPDFNSPDPAARNAAIIEAYAARDDKAIPDLVRMLDSDDPATRLLAIRTLESLTGTRLGYDPAAPSFEREPAVRAWAERVAGGRPDGMSAP